MYPEICKIGPFIIYSYGLALVLAFSLSTVLLLKQAKKKGFDPELIFNLAFLVFICGIIGSRVLYVVQNLGYYLKYPLEIIMLQHGGLSWFGGLLLGTISGVFYLKKKNLKIYEVLDLITPFVALGQSIGRIGCFLNGCCFGKPFQFPPQLISSFFLLLTFIFLRFKQERPHGKGEIFFTYLLFYSLKRFCVEFLRADNPIIFSGLTLFQIISIFIFFFSLARLVVIKKAKE